MSSLVQSLVDWVRSAGHPGRLSGIGERRITKGAYLSFAAVTIVGAIFVVSVVKLAGVVPLPWTDEVAYADPVLNWATGKGFTSGAWYSQPYGETWSSNSPLYAFLALPALKLFGTTVGVWRGFWAVSFVASIVLIVASSWKFKLIRSPISIFVVGAIFISAHSTSYLPVYGRGIDAACLLIVSVAIGGLAYTSGYWRVICLFAFGAAIPATGLQLGPSVAAVILCFMFVRWESAVCTAIWVGGGIIIGVIIVLIGYLLVGQAYEFTAMTFASEFTTVGSATQSIVTSGADHMRLSRYDVFGHYFKIFSWDISLFIVFICSFVSAVFTVWSDGYNNDKVISLSLAGLLVVPLAMIIAGRFARYYYWMSLIPAVLSIASINDASRRGNYVSNTLIFVVLVSCIYSGYINEVRQNIHENKMWYKKVENVVEKNISKGDTVMVSEVAYFEARKKSEMVYTDMYSGGGLFKEIGEEDRLEIEKLILREEVVDRVVGGLLGPGWRPVDRCRSEDGKRSLIVFQRTDGY